MKYFILAIVLALLGGCKTRETTQTTTMSADSVVAAKGTFGYDVAFMKKHKDVLVLGTTLSPARALLIKDYQGRVMTSSAGGDGGNSYGWVNYDLIDSDSLLSHMNPFGGEDRIWLGPEGGQYSVFFKPGSAFDFDHWQTPPIIDSEPFTQVSADSLQATFRKAGALTNYSGFTFNFEIIRQIRLWTNSDIAKEFEITLDGVKAVAFESNNSVSNNGPEPWTKNTGLISIWILGMMTPSEHTTLVLPYFSGPGAEAKITDNYFGKIPPERLVTGNGLLMMKADGRYRGKVGIAPSIAKNIAGSYNADKGVLTLVKFDLDKKSGYVNSKWEIQKNPFGGDAVNGYNDGPLATGGQLGPFYELESSSPARELKAGESVTHRHITVHLEGDEPTLSTICKKVLGVPLTVIKDAFPEK